MQIAGITKFSMLDYPGKISAIVFCQGCPLRCPYCHNEPLQNFSETSNVSRETFLEFLESRKGLLDAIVFSGGEPLSQKDLIEKMFHVKHFGFLVGIHTSGINPENFKKILNVADWIGFDIKTSFENYDKITQVKNSGKLVKESFEALAKSNVEFEIRTTFDSRFISIDDLFSVANTLKNHGIKKWVLQQCILRSELDDVKLLLPDEKTVENLSKIVEVEIRK